MPLFGTSFAPPPALSGLELEIILEESRMALSWDATALAQNDFGGYRVYRSLDGGTNFQLLSLQTLTSEVTFNDYEAPLNVTVIYRVTQSDLLLESDPAEASGTLADGAWWVVVPNDLSLTFPLNRIRAANVASPKVQDIYSPIGRETRVVVGDVVQTEEGSLSFLAYPDDPGKTALVKAIQARMDGAIILKSPDGLVHEVQFGSMTRAYTKIPGLFELTLPFYGAG